MESAHNFLLFAHSVEHEVQSPRTAGNLQRAFLTPKLRSEHLTHAHSFPVNMRNTTLPIRQVGSSNFNTFKHLSDQDDHGGHDGIFYLAVVSVLSVLQADLSYLNLLSGH